MKTFKMIDSRTNKVISEGDFLKGFYLKEGITPQEVPVGLFYDFKGNLKAHETADSVLAWMSKRGADEGREDLDEILKDAGLEKYDQLELAFKNNGGTVYDYVELI